ncbi:hypothetical protein CTEN210_06830 [Chaetoceros tenuissimus]|uniref:RapZ C-terminal domain-containing protein n=1 Tax=Chaetoceros tenuissimus TaxID=426638 RepID=A0AAD3CTI5_9STRA|nr:hypothetical protein CTEN210_06830 [Chaetoceros tenuissimus]
METQTFKPQQPTPTTKTDKDDSSSMQKSSSVPQLIIITITTFGTETGARPDRQTLDYETFKCHWIPNPSSKSRKGTTGESKKLRDEILSCPKVQEFVSNCVATIKDVILQIAEESNEEEQESRQYHFAFSCARGKHRSVSVAIAASECLLKLFPNVRIEFQHLGLQEMTCRKSKKSKTRSKRRDNRIDEYNQY